MRLTPLKKLLLIFLLFALALFISLPSEFNISGRKFERPNLDFKIGRFEIKKSFELVYGLDLAGGSHLVFEADTSQLAEEKRKVALEGVRDVIERRVNLFGILEPNHQLYNFKGTKPVITE